MTAGFKDIFLRRPVDRLQAVNGVEHTEVEGDGIGVPLRLQPTSAK